MMQYTQLLLIHKYITICMCTTQTTWRKVFVVWVLYHKIMYSGISAILQAFGTSLGSLKHLRPQ